MWVQGAISLIIAFVLFVFLMVVLPPMIRMLIRLGKKLFFEPKLTPEELVEKTDKVKT